MPSPVPEAVAWVGLDWADKEHQGRLQVAGSSQVESFVLPQRPAALQDWVGELRRRFPLGRIAVAVEQARGPLVYALMTYDFLLLYPVPPKTLADYRQAFFSSGAKSDPQTPTCGWSWCVPMPTACASGSLRMRGPGKSKCWRSRAATWSTTAPH